MYHLLSCKSYVGQLIAHCPQEKGVGQNSNMPLFLKTVRSGFQCFCCCFLVNLRRQTKLGSGQKQPRKGYLLWRKVKGRCFKFQFMLYKRDPAFKKLLSNPESKPVSYTMRPSRFRGVTLLYIVQVSNCL